MKYDICYTANHGFSARMLLQTGLLTKLADAGNKIALIVPDIHDSALVGLSDADGIELFQSTLELSFLQRQWLTFRKYLLQDITGNPALMEKYYHGLHADQPVGRKLRAYLGMGFSQLGKKLPFFRKWLKQKDSDWLASTEIKQLVSKINPKVVVVTYPMMSPEAQILIAANDLEATTVIHLLSWDNITSKGIFPALSDFYISWGPIMTAELKEYYQVSKESVREAGVPHFDQHAITANNEDTNRLLESYFELNSEVPFLLFTMSAPRFAPFEIDIVKQLAEKVDRGEFGRLQLLVRPHPQNMQGQYVRKEWLETLRTIDNLKDCYVNYPMMEGNSKLTWSTKRDDMYRFSVALKHALLVINSGSTTAIEALYFGKPVIFSSFDGNRTLPYWYSAARLISYTHLDKLIKTGAIDVASSNEELHQFIAEYLENPHLKYQIRRDGLFRQIADNEGKATENVVDYLTQLATK